MCSPWMHDLLNNVQAEREQAGLCKTGWMKCLRVLIYYMGLPGKRKRGLTRENILKSSKEIEG